MVSTIRFAADDFGAEDGATVTDGAASEELHYFQVLEEAFIRLRGAPLLLSPADWRVAQRWRELGIPLDFAVAGMTEVFARRRERGSEDRVSSLRYCARAVESGWRRAEELAGPPRRSAGPALDTGARLQSLARSIPAGFPDAERIVRSVLALRGDAAAVEAALVTIDETMLERAAAHLDAEEKAELDRWLERRLDSLRERFDSDELARTAVRLRSRELRRRAKLPLLSLFSPQAETGGETTSD
jgi:hypothetical protein